MKRSITDNTQLIVPNQKQMNEKNSESNKTKRTSDKV